MNNQQVRKGREGKGDNGLLNMGKEKKSTKKGLPISGDTSKFQSSREPFESTAANFVPKVLNLSR